MDRLRLGGGFGRPMAWRAVPEMARGELPCDDRAAPVRAQAASDGEVAPPAEVSTGADPGSRPGADEQPPESVELVAEPEDRPLPPEPSRLWSIPDALRPLLPPDRAITPHFWLREAHCHDGTPYPEEWYDRLLFLYQQAEVVRDEVTRLHPELARHDGVPVHVLDVYRSPRYNAQLPGAAKFSQHPRGRAMDFKVHGLPVEELHAIVLRLAVEERIKIGGLGLYLADGFVHMDTRDRPEDGHLARWLGDRSVPGGVVA